MTPIPEIIAAERLRDLQNHVRLMFASTGATRRRYRNYVRHDIAAWHRAQKRAAEAHRERMREYFRMTDEQRAAAGLVPVVMTAAE